MTYAALGGYVILLNLAWIAIFFQLRRKAAGYKRFVWITGVLAILGTVQIVLRIVELTVAIRESQAFLEGRTGLLNGLYDLENAIWRVQVGIFILNNIGTDSIFIYRCFRIWTSARYVIFLPITLTTATALLAIVAVATSTADTRGSYLDAIPFAVSASTNITLVLLTAGRIWWVRRDLVRLRLRKEVHRDSQYSLAFMIILESGFLYCISAATLTIVSCLGISNGSPLFFYLLPFFAQFVNIIPIITLIHASIGRNLEDVVSVNSSFMQSQVSSTGTRADMLQTSAERQSVGTQSYGGRRTGTGMASQDFSRMASPLGDRVLVIEKREDALDPRWRDRDDEGWP